MYINIKVFPSAGRSDVEQLRNGDLSVRLRSTPEDGKANKELISLLANYYKVPKKDVEIVKGHANRRKTISINLEE